MNEPLQAFRFRVEFFPPGGAHVPLCAGAFAECSGLEATMEPKAIRAGGHNYGDIQRAGRVTFATVILKRGVTSAQHLWRWFELVAARGRSAVRLDVHLIHLPMGEPPESAPGLLEWRLANALPTKFKAATYDASAREIAVEELHLVHEGLLLHPPRGDET